MYDYSLTVFSPSGKLQQIEYALTAVQNGSTALGIKTKHGVVLGAEKKVPPLVDPTTVPRISALSDNIGFCFAGMTPDSRVLQNTGRKAGQRYWMAYKDGIPVESMVRELAATMQEHTQSGGVRPFGVSLLVGGWDDKGPQLYQVDPSGSFWAWKAAAVGKNMSNASTFLEKRYAEDMELEDAVHTAINTLKEGFDGVMDENSLEIAVIGKDRVFRILTPQQIKEHLDILA